MKAARWYVHILPNKARIAQAAGLFSGLVTITLAAVTCVPQAQAQAPYLLPYTIQSVAGGGTVTASAPAVCIGAPAFTSYDGSGDGCPITSGSVVIGASNDTHDVAVDQQGNIFFIDNSSAAGVVRRIDAHTGVVTTLSGTYGAQTPCPTAIDKYGDGCQANDGLANAAAGYSNPNKLRGMGIAKNGDLYFADYSGNLVHKYSVATGKVTLVAGLLASGSKATSLGGTKGYSGDGGLAFNSTSNPPNGAAVYAPRGVGVDLAGNIYIADSSNNVIRKITFATGIISTIAGSPVTTAGVSGDGGMATSALLNTPEDVQADSFGNLYIADQGNARVRMIYAAGTVAAGLIAKTNAGMVAQAGFIYTIIGNGVSGTTPPPATNPGPVLATSLSIGATRKLAIDPHGNVFVADNGNDVVWFLDASTGFMHVVAGELGLVSGGTYCAGKTDAFGDNCPATQATMNPNGAMAVALDVFGQLYITDPLDMRLRRAQTGQFFPATASGTTTTQTLDVHFVAADMAALANPYSLSGSPAFKLVSSACTLNSDTTTDCLLNVSFTPLVPGVDSATLTVASTLNGSVSFGLSGTGTVATLAYDPGNTTALPATTLLNPTAAAQDVLGNTYVADTGNNRVVRFATGSGAMTVIAGTGTASYTGDGAAATAATLSAPRAVTVTRNGSIYIADTGNNVVRVISPATGVISTIAGGSTTTCAQPDDSFNDGCLGTAAKLSAPAGLASDSLGNVFIADTGNNIVRELGPAGYLALAAGPGPIACSTGDSLGNFCPATATSVTLNGPTGLAVDAAGNLYIADTGNSEIREITNPATPNTGSTLKPSPPSSISTIVVRAGRGTAGSSGNPGTALTAQLANPTGVAVDAAGNIYIADTGNNAISFVNGAGQISTVAGTLGVAGTGTLPGPASGVLLSAPAGVFSSGAGVLTLVDSANNRVLVDNRGALSFSFGQATPGTSSNVQTIEQTVTGSAAVAQPSPLFTASGNTGSFTLAGSSSMGCAPISSGTLAPGASCLLSAQFTPATLGNFAATFTSTATNASGSALGNPATPSIMLSGIGFVQIATASAVAVTKPVPPAQPQFASPFTVMATITPASCATGAPSCAPTGTVQFYVDGTPSGGLVTLTPNAGATAGTASTQINGLTVGNHTISVVYSGDTFYSSSTSQVITVMIAQGASTTTVSASAASSVQFTPLTLSASVTSVGKDIPTGKVQFYAGTMALGAPQPVNASTGIATFLDPVPASNPVNTPAPNSFGLVAGTYSLTAVYSGDANYAPSTSAPFSLTITPQPATFTTALSAAAVGTAQGSTSVAFLTVTPNNTVNDTLTFACSGMPVNSVCTFSPTTIVVTPVATRAGTQQTQVTFWTNIPPGVNPAQSSLWGWPVLLFSLAGLLAGRKRLAPLGLATSRLLTMLLLAALAGSGMLVLSGCSGTTKTTVSTAPGTYNVTVTVTGTANKATSSVPVVFTVEPGIPGQE